MLPHVPADTVHSPVPQLFAPRTSSSSGRRSRPPSPSRTALSRKVLTSPPPPPTLPRFRPPRSRLPFPTTLCPMDRAPCTRREGTGRAGSGPGTLWFYSWTRWKGPGSIAHRAGTGGGVPAHPINEAWRCFAASRGQGTVTVGSPWVLQGCPHAWECWNILTAPSEGPFPSCAALPTKRPPAPTRSTATESASGLAAKPSVRTWGSLSSKCHLFGGGFSISGWDRTELVEGKILGVGSATPKSLPRAG